MKTPPHISLLIFNHIVFMCLKKKRKKMNKPPNVSLILFAFKDI